MTRLSRDDFKVSFIGESYQTNENKIECRLTWVLKIPCGDFTDFYQMNWPHETYVSRGVAVCSKEDKYDEAIGKRLARTKAENKAYMKASAIMRKLAQELNAVRISSSVFKRKAEEILRHNCAYMNELESQIKPVQEPSAKINTVRPKNTAEARLAAGKPVIKRRHYKTPYGDVTVTEKRYNSTNLNDDYLYRVMKHFFNM